MSRLNSEFQRLYPEFSTSTRDPGTTATTQALVLELAQPGCWHQVATLWQSLQDDLDFPAPAIVVNGHSGFQLWLSTDAPVARDQASHLLHTLVQRYWAQAMPDSIQCWPAATPGPSHWQPHLPPHLAQPEQWSAVIARDLAPVFSDTPWLDIPPSPDGQADLLAALKPITSDTWARAMKRLTPPTIQEQGSTSPAAACHPTSPPGATCPSITPITVNPEAYAFLRATMLDSTLTWPDRIEAAKALLPYPQPV